MIFKYMMGSFAECVFRNHSQKNVNAVNRKRFYDLKMEMEIISENIKLSKVNLKADQTRFRFSYVIT